MKIVVIQGSLKPSSRTAIAVNEVIEHLKEKQIEHSLIDLREIEMEFCNGQSIEKYNQQMQDLYKLMESANGYIIGMPVYQTTVSGPLKNFLDIMNHAMYYKAVGMVVNSGGVRSYLAGADMLKILSYELWTVMVQPTVHTWAGDFADGKLTNEKARDKIALMTENVIRYSKVEPAKP